MKLSSSLTLACSMLAAFTISAHAEDSATVEKCSRNFGTLAVVEPQGGYGHLQRYGLGSPAALLRQIIQHSGCFDVVERGVAMQNMQQERALAQGGDLRQDSNIGKGQIQAADFVLTPNVQVGSSDTGGIGGMLSGQLGVWGSLLGGIKFKEASTNILLSDVRSSLQVAAAEGKATKTDFNIRAWASGNSSSGSGNGYTTTPEGKMIAASLLDNYNQVVLSIRDKAQLTKSTSTAADANASANANANAGVSTRTQPPQEVGQMLVAKIANVKVYEKPSKDSKVVATLQKSDELVASGEVSDGFVHVDSANFSGWVQRTLVMPRPVGMRVGAGSFTGQFF